MAAPAEDPSSVPSDPVHLLNIGRESAQFTFNVKMRRTTHLGVTPYRVCGDCFGEVDVTIVKAVELYIPAVGHLVSVGVKCNVYSYACISLVYHSGMSKRTRQAERDSVEFSPAIHWMFIVLHCLLIAHSLHLHCLFPYLPTFFTIHPLESHSRFSFKLLVERQTYGSVQVMWYANPGECLLFSFARTTAHTTPPKTQTMQACNFLPVSLPQEYALCHALCSHK